MDAPSPSSRIFTYDEAVALLPEVRRLTEEAHRRMEELGATLTPRGLAPKEARPEADAILREWAQALMDMGVEIKGLWLVDFDNGAGYYCWRYPEAGLQFFHGYEDGFQGRIPIN